MIANARMYSMSPVVAALWRRLLLALIEVSGCDVELVDHVEPAPISELWGRDDMAAVFMCGLPFSRSHANVRLVAAPVPSPPDFRGVPQYWSEMVVRSRSEFRTLEDTFGGRIALTVPDSQSGCVAALYHCMTVGERLPLYGEVIAPRVTPLGAMTAVVDGAADVAPIDSYAYCLLQKYRPDLTSQLRIVARTIPMPIPPLVASMPTRRAPLSPLRVSGHAPVLGRLQNAFLEAHTIAAIAPLMADLLLERFARPEEQTYDALRLNFDAASRYWLDHPLAATIHPAFIPSLRSFAG